MNKDNVTHVSHEGEIANIELGSPRARIRARGKFCNKDALDFVPTPESVYFYIDTPHYDGPLDLLLHLIRKHSMDIFDIPIVRITQKYLEALDEMRLLNLDVAGEFLVMAATLAEIKSKMLLPKEEQPEECVEEEDPRHELMKRLLYYKSFKEASKKLLERPLLGRDLFLRPFEDNDAETAHQDNEDNTDIDLNSLDIFELINSLNKVLKRSEHLYVHTITRDRISVSARMHELINFCQVKTQFSFYDALRFFPIYEKIDVIVTFLALLEMSRLKLLRIEKSFEEGLLMTVVKESFYNIHKEILENINISLEQANNDYD
jgi:segregation and condensation protein A